MMPVHLSLFNRVGMPSVAIARLKNWFPAWAYLIAPEHDISNHRYCCFSACQLRPAYRRVCIKTVGTPSGPVASLSTRFHCCDQSLLWEERKHIKCQFRSCRLRFEQKEKVTECIIHIIRFHHQSLADLLCNFCLAILYPNIQQLKFRSLRSSVSFAFLLSLLQYFLLACLNTSTPVMSSLLRLSSF